MSKQEDKSRLNALKPFVTLAIVVMGTAFLASCGGGSSDENQAQTIQSDSATSDDPTKQALGVSGGTVPAGWKGRTPVINFSGPIPYSYDTVQVNDRTRPVDEQVGFISNQYIIADKDEDRQKLTNILAGNKYLRIVAWRDALGYIVEVNASDPKAIAELERIRGLLGDSSVYQRSYVGSKVDLSYSAIDNLEDGGSNWHLEYVRAPAAWSYFSDPLRAPSVTVGVVDSGIYRNHPEVKDGIIENYSGSTEWHGTAVSGTIVGSWQNSDGFVGLAPMSRIIFGGHQNGDNYNEYYQVLSSAPRIINHSWGKCTTDKACTQQESIKHTRTHRNYATSITGSRILHVLAAGNRAVDAKLQNGAVHLTDRGDVAQLDNVLVVAAITADGHLSDTSDYGAQVDIAAPSAFRAPTSVTGSITSPIANYSNGASFGTNQTCAIVNGTRVSEINQCAFNGTSASAPVVTGVAALVLSINPALTAAEVKEILIKSGSNNKVRFRRLKPEEDFPQGRLVPLEHEIPIIDAAESVKMALEMKAQREQKNCGTISSPSITGQAGPSYTVTAGAVNRFAAVAVPKNGYLFGGYRWKTSEGAELLTTVEQANLTFSTPGSASVTVTPVLMDGTVCSLSAATANVTVTAANSALMFQDEFNGTALDLTKWAVQSIGGVLPTYSQSGGYLNINIAGGSCGSCGTADGARFKPKIDPLIGNFEVILSFEELQRLSRDGTRPLSTVQLLVTGANAELGIYVVGDASSNQGIAGHKIIAYYRNGSAVGYPLTRDLNVGQLYSMQFRIRRANGASYLSYKVEQDTGWTEAEVPATFPESAVSVPSIVTASGDGRGTYMNSLFRLRFDSVTISK